MNKRYIVIIGLLALALFCRKGLFSEGEISVGEDILPKIPFALGEWQGEDMPIDEKVFEILRTKAVMVRRYTKPNSSDIHLAIVSCRKRVAFHPPEICMTGDGAQMEKKDTVRVSLGGREIEANRIVIRNEDISFMSIYWFGLGDYWTHSYYKQQLKVVLDKVYGGSNIGIMIRLSTVIDKDGEESAFKRLEDFANMVIQSRL